MKRQTTFFSLIALALTTVVIYYSIIIPSKSREILAIWENEGISIEEAQERLKDIGYYKGKITGKNNIFTLLAADKYYKDIAGYEDELIMTTTGAGVVYREGSRGEKVREIQQKLINLGLLSGSADGIYGPKTRDAVTKFQQNKGLRVDGVVGNETLKALGIQASADTSSNSKNVNIMAAAIHGEARGEPYIGKVAVGAVIMNRVKDSRFPGTVAGVIYQPGAFTAVDDGQINLYPNEESRRAAMDAINGWDPTGGCVYYWNPVTATSKWMLSKPVVTKIGKHNFSKG